MTREPLTDWDRERKSELKVKRRMDAACKMCPQCYMIWYNAVRLCYECGFEFYPPKVKFNGNSDDP